MRITRIVATLAVCALIAPGAVHAAPDTWITAKAKMALLTAEDVPSTGINVDTMDGRVTLHGQVPTEDAKRRAEAAARSVEGVREVRNLLQVVPAERAGAVEASDDEIRQRVSKALEDDRTLADSDVDVESVNNGVVLLGGEARSVTEHLRALERARAVPGVRQVRSEIQSPDRLADAEIRRETEPAEAGTRGVTSAASDMWITSATKMRLLANADAPALDINVDTDDGVVTLFGIVPSDAAKSAAEAEARKVQGVRSVRNQLQVVPEARRERVEVRDDELREAVERTIEQRPTLADADIDVEVKNGVARLTGTVPGEQERLEAAVAARGTKGVRAVQQDLRVERRGAQPERPDTE